MHVREVIAVRAVGTSGSDTTAPHQLNILRGHRLLRDAHFTAVFRGRAFATMSGKKQKVRALL